MPKVFVVGGVTQNEKLSVDLRSIVPDDKLNRMNFNGMQLLN